MVSVSEENNDFDMLDSSYNLSKQSVQQKKLINDINENQEEDALTGRNNI
jgi:hypothetical protein